MFRITEDPSSGSLIQCLAKNYKNGSVVSAWTDTTEPLREYTLQKTGMFWVREISYHQTYSARDWLSILRTPYQNQNPQRKHRTDLHINWIIKCLIIIDAQCKHEEITVVPEHSMKAHGRSGDTAPLVPKLCTSWGFVVSLTPRSL